MRPELEDRLMTKYPELFRGRTKPTSESLMAYGCQCGDGWYGLLDVLCDQLMVTGREVGEIPEIVQVKEKFAALRVYLATTPTPDQWVALRFAERLSIRICDMCGSMADDVRVWRYGWHRTLCVSCADQEGYVAMSQRWMPHRRTHDQ